ncbi:MAG: CHASE2 domain-containing protein [Cyanobacteria bacterium J06629_18]
MSKTIVLNLGSGNLDEGFRDVRMQIGFKDNPHIMETRASLPPAPKISLLYQDWQRLYSAVYRNYGWNIRLGIIEDVNRATNISEADFKALSEELSSEINSWLNSEEFQKIERKLRTELSPNEEISFIISTNDKLLRRLPWHLWSFFEDYPHAEVGLSSLELQRVSRRYKPRNQINILAIFGNSQGIDINRDKSFLEKLSTKAKIKFLIEPKFKQLSDEFWEKNCDILFFAGHSYSQETGLLQINKTTTITLEQLKNGLKKAIENGLQLAIFNSCDGLGLAQALEDLHIPQVIVMREPVPDLVAQEFLKHFLTEFSCGHSLYSSVRQARKRLEGIQREFPYATWLPVICHNPLEPTMIWKQRKKFITRQSLLTVLAISFLVTFLVMGVRWLGFLQPSELHAYDRFMQLRSQFFHEPRDPHLLIVTIDEQDIQYQHDNYNDTRDSLSDKALADLLVKLDNQYKVNTVGLDLHRTHRVEKESNNFRNPYKDERLFVVCKAPTSANDGDSEGIRPPVGAEPKRIGFSDFVADDDGVARRHLYMMNIDSTSECNTPEAISIRLAIDFLKKRGKKISFPKGNLQIEDVLFKPLENRSSGYQRVDARGHQILLNYRSLDSVDEIADKVKLRDVLGESTQSESVKSPENENRIALIGRISPTDFDSIKDPWKTPFSSGAIRREREVPGVFVQAQMVSQIISSVLDGRPLLWWWSTWTEILWVWGWVFIGGIISWNFSKPLQLGLASTVILFTLFIVCFSIFTKAGWIPFIPCALGLIITQVAIVLYRKRASN